MSITPTTTTNNPDTATFTGQITSPRWQFIARILCLIVGLLSIGAFTLNLVSIYQYSGDLPLVTQDALIQLGLSPTFYFWINIIVSFVIYMPFFCVGVLIYWRRPQERIAVLSAILLIAFGPALLPTINWYALGLLKGNETLTGLALTIYFIVGPFAWPIIGPFFVLFPDGRFIPPWSKYVAVFSFVISQLWGLFPETFYFPQGIMILVVTIVPIILFGGGFYAQFYRYRYVSTPLQRQQTKWFVAALGLNVVAIGIVSLPFLVNPQLMRPEAGITALATEFIYLITNLILTIIPLAVGFAILRYRLWDVDLLINKSLVYVVITGLALTIFFIVILILQVMVGSQQPFIAFVIALIVCGALFNPMQNRVQRFVDRRLYRLRFDLNELNAAQKFPDVKNPGALTGRKIGPYDVLDTIGKGGMGEVYKGFCDGQTVALKILPEDLAQQDEYRTRFLREAETLKALNHPHIVKMYGSGQSDGTSYLAMEYIHGEELADVIKREGGFSPEDARDIIKGVAAALDYAHTQGFVHRDIKPSNIMLRTASDNERLEAVLMDFGIAKLDDKRTRFTATGAIGTIDYMAPEQIMTARTVDGRADVYALGIVSYEMLTGKRPFEGNAAQVMFAHLQQPAPDPRDAQPDIPRTMAKAILKALEKDPDERYTKAGEFAIALGD